MTLCENAPRDAIIIEMQDEMEEELCESTFEIKIEEECMGGSYFLENQAIHFPRVDIVVDHNGINKLSDPNMHYSRAKINPRLIQEKEVIGRGSAGQVRRAVYILNDKEYTFAVKSINAKEQDHRRQLLNDLREYLGGQNSEYLIEFYTCYYQDGLVKQVIEYMDAGTLRRIINLVAQRRLKPTQVQLASLIHDVAHNKYRFCVVSIKSIRDIKPENILLSSKGKVKITDFGVSKCIEHSLGRSMVGTVTYMSPERLSITKNTYTYKCDIWSLGLILYEVATGRRLPYESSSGNQNYFQISQKILKENPPEFSPNEFSLEMCDFLHHCLQKVEQERWSARELLEHPWIKANQQKGAMKQLVDQLLLI